MICWESERCRRCRYYWKARETEGHGACIYILYHHKKRGCPVDRCYRYSPKEKKSRPVC